MGSASAGRRYGMMATIDRPVNVFSSVDALRDWIVTLEDLRERYRDDHEALRRIAGEELHANRLLELIPTLPRISSPAA
jgi:hypothetical protein